MRQTCCLDGKFSWSESVKVTIAIPSFNYARYLPACLDSLANQKYKDIEVLISDGGSTDDSIAIIEKFCQRDQRFRLVSRQDKGQADAVNKAFSHATGIIFCFLNADDIFIRDDAIEKAVSAFETDERVDVISFGGVYVDETEKIIRPVRLRYHPWDDSSWMKYRTAVLQSGTFWRSHVWRTHPFQAQYHYVFDVEFFWHAFQNYNWHENQLALAGYRLHGTNKSVTVRPDRIRELAKFERIKFGAKSVRASYLEIVAGLAGHLPSGTRRILYLLVNSIAYLSCYRLPGI